MKYINQSRKWLVGCLIFNLSFSVFAANDSCQKILSPDVEKRDPSESGQLLNVLMANTALNKIAALDQAIIENSKSSIKYIENEQQLPLYLRVFNYVDLRNKYSGRHGLFLYAGVYFNGDILAAKQTVQSYLSAEKFYKLKWYRYRGSVKHLVKTYHWRIITDSGAIFRGMEGYALIADLYFGGNMAKAFDETIDKSGISVKNFKKYFHWQRFEGYTSDFYLLRRKVVNYYGRIDMSYRYEAGLDFLARRSYNGNRRAAYEDMKLVLHSGELKYLRWSERLINNL